MNEMLKVFLLFKIISLGIAVVLLGYNGISAPLIATGTLIFACLLTLEYYGTLLELKRERMVPYYVILLIILLLLRRVELIPIMSIYLLQLLYNWKEKNQFYLLGIVCCIVSLFLCTFQLKVKLIACLLWMTFFITSYFAERVQKFEKQMLSEREEINVLEEKLQDEQMLTKTIRYSAVLEERNRLAVRLHDKVGHNISGSIVMLEAAMLQFEKHPEKAKEGISIASENLRNGVDEIRKALREEKPVASQISSQDIQLLLHEAKVKYRLHTNFFTEGDLDKVTSEHWKCIQENTYELLTNVVKHSTASSFHVTIKVMSSIIQVIYQDNGACEKNFRKGMGLQAVEERTIRSNGKCFMEGGELGFKVTNLFLI